MRTYEYRRFVAPSSDDQCWTVAWEGKSAQQLRDELYPGMDMAQRSRAQGSLRGSVRHCATWVLQETPTAKFPKPIIGVLLIEDPQ